MASDAIPDPDEPRFMSHDDPVGKVWHCSTDGCSWSVPIDLTELWKAQPHLTNAYVAFKRHACEAVTSLGGQTMASEQKMQAAKDAVVEAGRGLRRESDAFTGTPSPSYIEAENRLFRAVKAMENLESSLPTRTEFYERHQAMWNADGTYSGATMGEQHWADAFRNAAEKMRAKGFLAFADMFDSQATQLEDRDR